MKYYYMTHNYDYITQIHIRTRYSVRIYSNWSKQGYNVEAELR